MKRLISLILLVCCPAVLVAAEAVVITPGQTVIVQTSAGPATGVVLPAADGQSYLVLSLSVPGGNLAVPYVIAPYGAAPIPGPGPGPGPGPTPVPGGKLFVLVVTETKDQTPEQAAVLGSKAAIDLMAAKSWQWRVVDKDVVDENGKPPADIGKWITQAKTWAAAGNKLPCLLILDQQGAVLSQGPLPATEAAYLEVLKKFGGP
jgi:hypothetical protein